jgi:hypothetical protein
MDIEITKDAADDLKVFMEIRIDLLESVEMIK